MAHFLEITTGTSTTRTYINLDKINVVQLTNTSVRIMFDNKESEVSVSDIDPENYEKLRVLFGAGKI